MRASAQTLISDSATPTAAATRPRRPQPSAPATRAAPPATHARPRASASVSAVLGLRAVIFVLYRLVVVADDAHQRVDGGADADHGPDPLAPGRRAELAVQPLAT